MCNFFGEIFSRPRIITIPATIILLASLIFYIFHIIISFFLEKSKLNKNSFSGLGIIFGGIFGFIIIISTCWFINIFTAVKYENHTFINKTSTSHISQEILYQVAKNIFSRNQSETASNEAIAKLISSPNSTILSLKKIISSNLIQDIINDPNIGKIIKSQNPDLIFKHESVKKLFSMLINSILKIGDNKIIINSFINLKSKNLLSLNNFHILIRDPDFDCIIGELIK